MALLYKLRNTPLHPQWFAFFRDGAFLEASCADLAGIVVDIGCADAKSREFLPAGTTYIGVDYRPTATEWYRTRPDLYADAQALSLGDESVDHVLLLDVLEHIPEPGRCLAEIHRVLKRQGTLTLQVPFLYPIHDVPLDFHRWTRHGLHQAAKLLGFRIVSQQPLGHPAETAALNANIAMSKTVLNWMSGRNPMALTVVALPFAVLILNCLAWLVAVLSHGDDMMPYAYRMTWVKA
ncbi:MAG: hypothetical protein CL933_02110 [Deltaproteobacteria bacterium]|nr:hypothetical protein [Deltaproteobacteria bacterium]